MSEPLARTIATLGEVMRHAVRVAYEHGDGCGMEVIRDFVYGEPEACEGLPPRERHAFVPECWCDEHPCICPGTRGRADEEATDD